MRNTKIKTKTEKGITLIALIITIVVLLILAVVAINSIQNDGIISKAQSAADKYNQSVQNEADQLQNYLNYLNEHNGGSENGEGNEQKTYVAYTVGQEVKLKDQTKETESFYVLANSDTTEEKVTLITELCINTDDPENIIQSSTPSTMAFAKTNDWYPVEGAEPGEWVYLYGAEGSSLYGTVEPSPDHYAAYAAYKYGEKIGGFGRLMEYGETDLVSWTAYGTYWGGAVLGLEDDPDNPYRADLYDLIYGDTSLTMATADYSSTGWVRPVVEISKDLIVPVTAE